jgi:hypothetical protein
MMDTKFLLLLGGIGAVLVVTLLLWGLRNRLAWRLLSVLAVGSGVGLLVWGITSASLGEEPSVGSPTSLMGTGAGVMAGGIMLLIISFPGSGRCK